ncbi:MAG: hypothetical protein ACREX9_19080 [Gammaproteobacteria bacterium]
MSALTKSQLYEALEPRVNAGELELLDVPKLIEQLLGLVAKGTKIDHLPGDHDDLANAAAGAVSLCTPVLPISVDARRDLVRAPRHGATPGDLVAFSSLR